MSYGGYLAGNPYFWSLVCGGLVGSAAAFVTLSTRRAADRELARIRNLTVAVVCLSGAVAAAAAGIILPERLAIGRGLSAHLSEGGRPAVVSVPSLIAFGAGFGVFGFGLRFVKSIGIPLLVLLSLGVFAFGAALRPWSPVREATALAELRVLVLGPDSVVAELQDLTRPQAVGGIVRFDGRAMEFELAVLEPHELAFLAGAARFAYLTESGGDAFPAPSGAVAQVAYGWMIEYGVARVEPYLVRREPSNVLRAYRLVIGPTGPPRIDVQDPP